jgi:hypothetical protein
MLRTLTLTIVFLTISNIIFSQSGYFYKGEEITLKIDSTMFFIKTEEQNKNIRSLMLEDKKQRGSIQSFFEIINNGYLIKGNDSLNLEGYYSNIYRNDQNGILIILPRIVLMLKPKVSINALYEKYKNEITIESGKGQKYILKINTNKSENVIFLANELHNRDDIIWCEPEFLSEFRIQNTYYENQYYLNNIGQNGGTIGIDINIEPAWEITDGCSDITVSVIDEGVDQNHEDLASRVLEGFTIRNPQGNGIPQNEGATISSCKGHGMACSGIIAASNNSIGIRGIANNINILPVNIVPDPVLVDPYGNIISGGFGSNIEIAEAINWAWKRSDILSCSWGGQESNDIEAAIDSARTYGRNGKGTIVVFSSGNNNNHPLINDVSFPGNVDGVITVGAINNQGIIWDYSQRGSSMDLVAPTGDVNLTGDITTTDRMGNLGYNNTNYMNNFGGTSAACPQVAGVAALMLSMRPDLTEAQVRTTLQNTARDIGISGFDNTYGYGLVDAYAAVYTVAPSITGPSLVCTSISTFTLNNLPSGATVDWSCGNNMEIVTENSSTCTVRANGNGNGNGVGLVQAEISFDGINPIVISKDVWVGLKASFQGPSSVRYNGSGTWTADASCGFEPYLYQWWLREDNTGVASRLVSNSNPLVLYSFPRSFVKLNDVETRQPTTNTTYYLQLEVIDDNLNQYLTPEQKIVAYGDVDLISRDIFLVKNTEKDSKISENLILRISPNPANEYINIQMDTGVNESRQSSGDDNKVYVRLYNNNSMPVIDKVFYSENFTINTSNLQQGIYQLQVIYKGKKHSIQILVQH